MNRKFFRAGLIGLLCLVTLPACATGHDTEAYQQQASCVCGETQGDLHGCQHPRCASGEGNPDNPLCVCSPLKPVDAGEK